MPKYPEPESSMELRDAIRGIIVNSGMSEAEASRRLLFRAPSQLHRRLNEGKPPFSRAEIENICKVFKLSQEERIDLLRLRGDVVIIKEGAAPQGVSTDDIESFLRAIISSEPGVLPALIAEAVHGTMSLEQLQERISQMPGIEVGNVEGTGVAIGHGASATVIKIGSIQFVLPPQQDKVDYQVMLNGLLDDNEPLPREVPANSSLGRRNLQFVGREADMRVIAKALHRPQACVVIYTLGGQGKTQLANEFAHRYGYCFAGGVFWINASSHESIVGDLVKIGEEYTPSLWNKDEALTNDQKAKRVQSMLRDSVPRLLVFDNCEQHDLLKTYAPSIGGCRSLVTSRYDRWPGTFVNLRHELKELDRSDSIKLLCSDNPYVSTDDSALNATAQELNDLPLALALAGSYMRTRNERPDVYLEALRRTQRIAHKSLKREGMPRELATDYDTSLYSTFELSYRKLVDDHAVNVDKRARAILLAMAQLAAGTEIAKEIILTATKPQDAGDYNSAGDDDDEDNFYAAQERLAQLGLIQRPNQHVQLHRLIADFVRLQPEAQEPTIRIRAGKALYDLLEEDTEFEALGHAQYIAHLKALSSPPAMVQSEQGRVTWVHLMRYLGNMLNENGLYTEAIQIFNGCLPVARSLSDKLLLARILHNLGNNYLARYDTKYEEFYQEARAIYQHFIDQGGDQLDDARRRALDLDIAMSIAIAHHGNVDSAILRLEELLSNPVAVAESRITDIFSNLAMITANDGRAVSAVEYAKRGLGLRQVNAEDDYESLMLCGVVLSDAARRAGQPMDAVAFAKQALEDAKRDQKPVSMLTAQRTLGDALLAIGEIDAATTYINQAADRLPANKEAPCYDCIIVRAAQARLAAAQNDSTLARQLAEDTIEHARPLFLNVVIHEMKTLLATLES